MQSTDMKFTFLRRTWRRLFGIPLETEQTRAIAYQKSITGYLAINSVKMLLTSQGNRTRRGVELL